MKISKNKIMYFGVVALLLGLFNLIAFLVPFTKGGHFWVGYISITLSYIVSTVVLYLIFDKKELKSRFYRVPLIYVIRSYVILQFILGIAQMSVPSFDYKYAIVVNAIVFVFSIIGLISVTAGTEEIERIDEKIKEKVSYIRKIQIEVENLIDDTTEEKLLSNLNELKELIRHSDPISKDDVQQIEADILEKIKLIDSSSEDKKVSLVEEIKKLIKERNRIVKNFK
ncbi:MAG TPA: hypothetical protein GX708_01735 [Gallicola sp.]|nr:hypothetical protein [Gallicola sp.]